MTETATLKDSNSFSNYAKTILTILTNRSNDLTAKRFVQAKTELEAIRKDEKTKQNFWQFETNKIHSTDGLSDVVKTLMIKPKIFDIWQFIYTTFPAVLSELTSQGPRGRLRWKSELIKRPINLIRFFTTRLNG